MTQQDRTLLGIAIGAASALLVAMSLVAVRGEVAPANIALALVLPVLLATAIGGRIPGTTTALIAALGFDFFHTQPYLSLKITSANDVITTLILLALGLAAGQIDSRAIISGQRRRRHLAALSRLGRITELAVSGGVAEDIASGVAAELIGELGLADCWYEPAPFLGELPRLQASGFAGQRLHRLGANGGLELPREGAEILVMGHSDIVGRFVLLPTHGHGVTAEQRMVALALVGQLAIRLSGAAA